MKNGYGVPAPALWLENLERANALTTGILPREQLRGIFPQTETGTWEQGELRNCLSRENK